MPAFERAEALAQQDPEAADQLDRIYDGLAATYRGMGELNRAAEFYQRSIALAEKLGNAPAIASAYNGLGILHRMRGDTEPAVQAFERSLALLPARGLDARAGAAIQQHRSDSCSTVRSGKPAGDIWSKASSY